jgi:hypothetical protein
MREIMRSAFRLFLLTLLFSVAAVYEAGHQSALFSSDVWWHLRTGLWIWQNHTFPRTGLFSQYSDLPWIASSWGHDVLFAATYKLLGLHAIPILLMGLKVALAVVTFLLARAARANFWTAVILSATAQYVIPNLQPVPAVLSILFFGLELALLVKSRRSGDSSILFWLPLLFFVWANLHLQFVLGLLLLGLFLTTLILEPALRNAGVTLLSDRIQPLPLAKVGIIAGLSFLCTIATPYTVHLLPNFVKALYSSVAFQYGAEMRAMSFRRPQEFLLMLLVMTAFFALGRRRSLELFELLALAAGTALAFRIQRDAWIAVLPAIAVLADGFHSKQVERDDLKAISWQQKAFTAALTTIVLVAAALRLPDQGQLMNKVSETFPVKACDFITKNHLPPPMFSTYSWGGFLTWYLPDYPMAVDSRVDLYGDEILTSYFQVITGKERLDTNASLASAHTLLLEKQSGMADALVRIPVLSSQYRKVYSDDLAAVFVKNQVQP